jgi:hypothetical protein
MPRYMPQFLFDGCAVSVAMYYDPEDSVDISTPITLVLNQYQKDYEDDQYLEKDLAIAATGIYEFVVGYFSRPEFSEVTPERLISAFKQLRWLASNYEINGKKKRKKLFGGTLFNSDKEYFTGRAYTSVTNIEAFHNGTVEGIFPISDEI